MEVGLTLSVGYSRSSVESLRGRIVIGVLALIIGLVVGGELARQVASGLPLVALISVTVPAYILATRNSRILLPYVITVWVLNPELRRIVDWILGAYQPVTVISLSPLLCTLAMAIPVISNKNQWSLSPRLTRAIKVLGVVLLYGLLLGIIHNKTAGMYAGANYIDPFILLLYLIRFRPMPETFDRWLRWISVLAVVVSIYGWIQYLVAPPWDTLWMIGSGMRSIGLPEPHKIRIFSTLNSPGPLGIFLTAALVPMVVRGKWRAFGIPGVLVVASCLALTLVRSSWGEVVVGVIVYLISTTGKSRVRSLLVVGLAFLIGAVVLPHLPGAHAILTRGQTVGNLGQDTSLQARLQLIRTATPAILHNPIGVGMGGIGISTILNGGNAFAGLGSIDNGYLGIFATFGLPFGILMLYSLFLFGREVFIQTDGEMRIYVAMSRAGIASFLAALFFGGALQSLQAILLWIIILPGILMSDSNFSTESHEKTAGHLGGM